MVGVGIVGGVQKTSAFYWRKDEVVSSLSFLWPFVLPFDDLCHTVTNERLDVGAHTIIQIPETLQRYVRGQTENSGWILKTSCGEWCTLHDTTRKWLKLCPLPSRIPAGNKEGWRSTIAKAWTPQPGRHILLFTLPKCENHNPRATYRRQKKEDGVDIQLLQSNHKKNTAPQCFSSRWGYIKEGRR